MERYIIERNSIEREACRTGRNKKDIVRIDESLGIDFNDIIITGCFFNSNIHRKYIIKKIALEKCKALKIEIINAINAEEFENWYLRYMEQNNLDYSSTNAKCKVYNGKYCKVSGHFFYSSQNKTFQIGKTQDEEVRKAITEIINEGAFERWYLEFLKVKNLLPYKETITLSNVLQAKRQILS